MLYKVANVLTGAGSEASKQDEGASLTSVLDTPALRVELALLVLLCTDGMRSDLLATFDADKTHETACSTAPAQPPPSNPQSPVQDLISFNEPENEALSAARRARQREMDSTQMQALRRSALTFFDKWRAGVMHRICDVLCVRGEVVRQAKAKRRQMLDEAKRQKQGNSLLIDFEGDPFGSEPVHMSQSRRKHGRYDVVENKLLAFEEQKRVLVLHCLLLLLLSLEHYSAHSRVLLLHLTSSLELEASLLAEHEKSVAQGLLATAASQMDAEDSAKKQASNDAAARKWKVGLAAVGGAVLIGVTGGLAAPLLAAGIGTVMGGLGLGVVSTYLGALAGSSVLVGSLFGAYGAKMTSKLMEQYAKEVQDFEFIPVQDPERPAAHRNHEWSEDQDARDPKKREQHRLRVSIGISGWLSSPSDVNKPWEIIDAVGTEPFALRFELDAMLRLGNSLNDVLFSYAWDGVTYTIVSRTILGALYAGLWPLGLVKVASVLDNPFSVALARADKAGKVLAHALIDGVQGRRPVTLIGYSVGARVIYACLVELAKQHAFGLVESVVLMGAPSPSDTLSWRQIRSVVAARVVNVYSTEDYILGFLYRSTKLELGVAGLQDIKDVHGIENVDMSKLVSGHDRYRYLIGTILTKIGLGDIEFDRVAEQERALELAEKKKQQTREHVKKHVMEKHQPNPSASDETSMIVVQGKSNKLVDVAGSSTMKGRSMRGPSDPPLERPPPTISYEPEQQPSIRQRTTTPRVPSSNSASSETIISSGATEPQASSSPATQSTSPVASLLHQQQIAPNTVLAPEITSQNVKRAEIVSSDTPDNNKITIRDFDTQKFSPPLEEMLKQRNNVPSTPKTEPKLVSTVAVNEVPPGEEESSEDETSSEFGELSAVEPVPLDDNDYGLI